MRGDNVLADKPLRALLESGIITNDEYEVLRKRINPATNEDNSYTWGEILEKFLEWCNGKYTIITAKGYKICINQFARYFTNSKDNKTTLDKEFKVYSFMDVNLFINKLQQEGMSAQTCSKTKYSMIVFGNFLNSIGIKTPDIQEIKTPIADVVHQTKTVLSDKEIYDIAMGADIRTKVCILLCFEGGLKRQEICKIKIQDFDIKKRQLFIYNDDNKFERVCILSIDLITEVDNYIMELYDNVNKWNDSRIAKGKPVREDLGYLFQNVKTVKPSYSMLQSSIKKAALNYYKDKYTDSMLEEKVSNFTFETIRNSRRVYLLAHGRTVQQVMDELGDNNYKSTYRFKKFVPVFYNNLI